MRKTGLYIFSILFAVCNLFVTEVFAQDIPDKPSPPRLVNDFAGFLNRDEINYLEHKLVAFSDTTSTQIAIVIVPSLNGYDKSDYAQRLGEKWGIGIKGLDNGVLILVKPKTADSRGEVFITTGYGLEGVIPDLVCGEIVDYEIIPSFKAGNYFKGLNDATNTLIALANGEFTAAEYEKYAKKNSGNKKGSILPFLIITIILVAIISGRSGGSNNKNISSRDLPFWLLLGMMGSGRNSHGGSWGGFSGGGGGGFGGFGGGSFGGGGAGGSW